MAIPNNFNPTNNFTYSSILANTVIKKQNKDTVVAGGEAPKGSGGSQDHDAYLRQQVLDVAETAAGGVKETKRGSALDTDLGPVTADFASVPKDVFVSNIMPHLNSKSLNDLRNVSQQCRRDVEDAENNAKKQLPSLMEKLNRLILESGITGIQLPEFLFTSPIVQLGVLETLEKNLPNAINILKNHKIEDLNAGDEGGNTPLHEAAVNGNTEIVKALITAGADVNATDEDGKTPLYWAARNGRTETVQALITAGADVNAQNIYGHTPLHEAAVNRNTETVQAFITAGANVNAQNIYGHTPLHKAADCGHTETVRAFITAGANMDAKDKYGYTPLHWASTYGRTETVILLRAVQNTPLVSAANGGTEEFNLENSLSPETIQLEEAPNIETIKKQRCLPKSCTMI